MAQVRFYGEFNSVIVQADYYERQNPIRDEDLEFMDEERKLQLRSNTGCVDLQVESMTIKKKLMALIESNHGIPVTFNNSLSICIGYQEYLLLKRYLGEHAKELPIRFEFSENNFPAEMKMGLAS